MCDPKARDRSKYQKISCEWCCRMASGLDEDGDLECSFCWALRGRGRQGNKVDRAKVRTEREDRIKGFLEKVGAPRLEDLCRLWNLSKEEGILRIETCGLKEYRLKEESKIEEPRKKSVVEDLNNRVSSLKKDK